MFLRGEAEEKIKRVREKGSSDLEPGDGVLQIRAAEREELVLVGLEPRPLLRAERHRLEQLGVRRADGRVETGVERVEATKEELACGKG